MFIGMAVTSLQAICMFYFLLTRTAKAAAHDLNGTVSMFNAAVPGLHFPMMGFIFTLKKT